MTEDEARDLFSEAYEGELDEAQRAAFDAALAEDEVLAFEYDEFVAIFDSTHAMDTGGLAPPDLLPGVQRKLRERSRGRYYRDVFAERPKPGVGMMPMVVACVLILLTLAVYFGMHFFQMERQSPDSSSESSEPSTSEPSAP